MGKVFFNGSMSLDGFVAGPNHEVDQLFGWYSKGDTPVVVPGTERGFRVSAASAQLFKKVWPTIGAMVTGRRTFNLAGGWGGKPPLGVPHVVVTHHAPPEWEMPGSVFTFVTDGVANAVAQAQQIAGAQNVVVSSANIMQQCLQAGLLDEIHIDLVPVVLGAGVRLFDNLEPTPYTLEIGRVVEGVGVTHLMYRVVR